jgi:sulfur relay protein TusB/DsrH
MQTCVIISNLETSTFPIITSLAKQEEGLNLILLSDATFLLDDSTKKDFFDELEKYGVNLFITIEDMEKRNCQLKSNLQILSYESLVEMLLSEQTSSINL